MKLLYLVPYTPSPVRVRSYNLIRTLAQCGHEVTLGTLWSDEQDRTRLAELNATGVHVLAARLTSARRAWNCLGGLSRPTPLQSVYCWQPALFALLQREIQSRARFDLIHIEHLRGARYGTHLQTEIKTLEFGIPIVWDSVDCISYLFEQAIQYSRSPFWRLVTRLELPRTRWYEAWLVGQFDRTLVTSALDRDALCDLIQEFAPAAFQPSFQTRVAVADRIRVLQNGVDLDYFRPRPGPREPQTIVFTGKMSYHANNTAARYLVNEVMPGVWARFPNVRVQIVGQGPPRSVQQLARANPNRVEVTGWVPDLRPYLARATLAAAPIIYGAEVSSRYWKRWRWERRSSLPPARPRRSPFSRNRNY